MDGRRHSVDIPISKALIALRRVRSLRDPSTNSMRKFPALAENVDWDTNSCNGISLQFVEDLKKGGSMDDGQLGHGSEDKPVPELDVYSGVSKDSLICCQDPWIKQVEEEECQEKKRDGVDILLSERYHPDHMEDGCDHVTPTTNHLEDMDSCSATPTMATSSPMEKVKYWASVRKSYQRNQRRASGAVADLSCCVGTPKLSASDDFPEGSSQNTSLLFANEEYNGVDHRYFGEKVGCCWTRTSKLKCSNPFSDFEDKPLLNDTTRYGYRDGRRLYNVESTPYSGTPRSLGQKYRPKSFKDLVGQNFVARSLLGGISRGRVSSVYLFHGPRGTGKTSASRIFAAALNCLALEEHGPCGLCRECVMLFRGGSRDVREFDSVLLSRADSVRSLLKSASIPPASSQFKVFIMDECQLMREESWAMISNSLDSISRHTVFVMITPDLDKLPRSVVSRSQRYHFPKIKDADIASRLGNVCSKEGLDFDHAALEFIAAKSNGSLRDAEMMLDQLSLLGKRITMSMAHELVGTVSDDDLLDLLDLALSSDTANTVIKARELMRSRIDPVQLTSQLATLIMDILSANCQEQSSEVRQRFLRSHNSEADLHKMGHALKILSETEKQLRTSKNQTTWLTAALLQLSSSDYSSLDEHYLKFCSRDVMDKDIDGDNCGRRSITVDSKKHFNLSSSDNDKTRGLRVEEDNKQVLDAIWRRAVELCKSNSLKSFLRKQGKLSSVGLNNGTVIAEMEFENSHNVLRAEKSWKVIASSLQYILGRNVEIRINLVPGPSVTKCSKVKKISFNLFGCSLRMEHKTNSHSERGSDSDCSGYYTSEKPMIGDRPHLACSPSCRSQQLHTCHHVKGASSTLRNGDGNILGIGNCGSRRSLHDCKKQQTVLCADCSEEELRYWRHQVRSIREPGIQLKCISTSALPRCQDKLNTLETTRVSCQSAEAEAETKLALSSPRKLSCETLNSAGDLGGLIGGGSDVLCWRTPRLALRRTFSESRHKEQSSSRLMGWVLPCASVK